MSEILERKTLGNGDTVFRQGETGGGAYIVQEGDIEIVRVTDGEEKVLATIGKGRVFLAKWR